MEFAARTEAPGRKFVRDENNGIVETSNGGGIYTRSHMRAPLYVYPSEVSVRLAKLLRVKTIIYVH